ncbi:MAG: LmbE family protein [Planctomycetaceae bacterium]|nr:LmbE family protein [Planctomycetaceae bacterium]
MKLDFSSERILAVVAHPDDAELLCAGTLARARAEGADVAICTLCRGDKGLPSGDVDDIGEVRRAEMQEAAELLGATYFPAGFDDGMLVDEPDTRAALNEIYRQFRPTLVLAHAPNDYHADHRAASGLAEAVSWFCASRGHITASAPLDVPPELWWMDTVTGADFEPGFYVDVSKYTDVKEQMLACHASQIARASDGDLGPLCAMMQVQSRMRGLQAGVQAAEAFQIHRAFRRSRAW